MKAALPGAVVLLASGLWLAWPWLVPLFSPVPTSGAGSDLVVVLDGGSGRFATADRIGQELPQPPHRLLIRCPRGTPPPQPTPELLQGFDTATQITALAHWLRHQPSPASPSAARAFALALPICLPPAPVNAVSCFGMPCASPSGAPLGPPALGWLPRLLPASGRIVGFSPSLTHPFSPFRDCGRGFFYGVSFSPFQAVEIAGVADVGPSILMLF